MAASRINLPMDRATSDLIAVTRAVMLAGDRALPRSTGRSAFDLARAIRSAFDGGANDLALTLVDDLRLLLAEEGRSLFVNPILDRLTILETRYAAHLLIELGARALDAAQIEARSA